MGKTWQEITRGLPQAGYVHVVKKDPVRRGLLFTGAHNMALAHGAKEVDAVCRIYDEVFPAVADAVRRGDVASRLEGPPVEPVFRNP